MGTCLCRAYSCPSQLLILSDPSPCFSVSDGDSCDGGCDSSDGDSSDGDGSDGDSSDGVIVVRVIVVRVTRVMVILVICASHPQVHYSSQIDAKLVYLSSFN